VSAETSAGMSASFRAHVLTLYPEMFPGALGHSLAGRALGRVFTLDAVQIRDFASDRHRTVDDTPAGGGPGMVMRADVLARAIDAVSPPGDPRPRLLMTPRGRPLTQARVRALAAGPGAVILCGRFEGVDERLIAARGLEEVSIGDYVLSGGEPAALVLLDAVVRLLPGVMGNAGSGETESFEGGLLEHPQYTRPPVFEGLPIPPVLLSGDHARIAAWRRAEAERLTAERRPDLLDPPERPTEPDAEKTPGAVDKSDRFV
jgi:tRNA (guanine37-N1)-methyltransferase